MTLFSTILSFLIVLTIVVFIHELGHFLVARKFGVRILTFSIGFGKELFGFTDKLSTRWSVSPIPLGGYVKMYGDADSSSHPDYQKLTKLSKKDKLQTFYYKPLWQKSLIVAAGPIANFILSFVIFTTIFAINGIRVAEPIISEVLTDSPAAIAGLQAGDRIITANEINISSFSDLEQIIATHLQQRINLKILRDDKNIDVFVVPELIEVDDPLGNKAKLVRIGIKSSVISHQRLGMFESLKKGAYEIYRVSVLTLDAIGDMILGKRGTEELGGPIKIAQFSNNFFQQGVLAFFYFIALISANLGLFNLLPIPILDGGHLLFYLVRAISNEKISVAFEKFAFKIGVVIITFLLILTTYNDLKSIGLF